MLKIATHNSATAEKGAGLLSLLVRPFSKCQNLTLREQHRAGCRLFDIRVKRHRNGNVYCYHGLWRSREPLSLLLTGLNAEAAADAQHPTLIFLTYEGRDTTAARHLLHGLRLEIAARFPHLCLKKLGIKHPYGTTIYRSTPMPKVEEDYSGISFKNHRWMLPIPRFWWKRRPKPNFNQNHFTMVDFLQNDKPNKTKQ